MFSSGMGDHHSCSSCRWIGYLNRRNNTANASLQLITNMHMIHHSSQIFLRLLFGNINRKPLHTIAVILIHDSVCEFFPVWWYVNKRPVPGIRMNPFIHTNFSSPRNKQILFNRTKRTYMEAWTTYCILFFFISFYWVLNILFICFITFPLLCVFSNKPEVCTYITGLKKLPMISAGPVFP